MCYSIPQCWVCSRNWLSKQLCCFVQWDWQHIKFLCCLTTIGHRLIIIHRGVKPELLIYSFKASQLKEINLQGIFRNTSADFYWFFFFMKLFQWCLMPVSSLVSLLYSFCFKGLCDNIYCCACSQERQMKAEYSNTLNIISFFYQFRRDGFFPHTLSFTILV